MTAEMPDDTRAWLERAQDDRRWAEFNLSGGFISQACFACQQAVEMLLKAFLLAHNAVPPKTHDLVDLAALCTQYEPSVGAFEDAARTLTQYYVATRYLDLPEAKRDYTKEDAIEALEHVDRFIGALRPIIEARLQEP